MLFYLGDGTLKEEVWEEKEEEQEDKVKMGNVENFRALTEQVGNSLNFDAILNLIEKMIILKYTLQNNSMKELF